MKVLPNLLFDPPVDPESLLDRAQAFDSMADHIVFARDVAGLTFDEFISLLRFAALAIRHRNKYIIGHNKKPGKNWASLLKKGFINQNRDVLYLTVNASLALGIGCMPLPDVSDRPPDPLEELFI